MNPIFLIAKYKYLILAPLGIVEGPIVTIVAGFFCSLGLLNPFIVYPIMVVGDIIGDTILYFLGHSGGKLLGPKLRHRLQASPERQAKITNYYKTKKYYPLILSKILHGAGMAGLIAAGSAKVPFKRYLGVCITTSLIQSAVLLLVGIFFGHAYLELGRYLNFFVAGTILLAIIIVLAIFIKKKYGKKKIIDQL